MSDIYDKHSAAFSNVAAFVIAKNGKRVGTIAFKFGNAVTAYVHWHGPRMVRGLAKGGGYDRKSAACEIAARQLESVWAIHIAEMKSLGMSHLPPDEMPEDLRAFRQALEDGDGPSDWNTELRKAGFEVWQAV